MSENPTHPSPPGDRPVDRQIDRVIVLGGGSAGFLAAITLKTKVPDLRVSVIRSKELGIIGVGEGTTVSVPNYLHAYLGIDSLAFHRAVRPTFKLGIKFYWGPRPHFNYTFARQFNMRYAALPRLTGFYCDDDTDIQHAGLNAALMTAGKAFGRQPDGSPAIRNEFAYHMENAEFVGFLETYAAKLGVQIVDDTIAEVRQDDRGIAALVGREGAAYEADLFLDSSGFVSALLGKALREPFISFKSSLFCDRAVVGGWARPADDPIRSYTTAETMDAGWCWRIDHENRINRGYVYSGSFITDDAAEAEFRRKNPRVESTRIVKFVSGRYERAWVKNVVGIGNAYGFVEPLESTSLAIICEESGNLADSLIEANRRPGPAIVRVYNKRVGRAWDDIRRFLAIHYRFNRRLDTEFWRACLEKADLADGEAIVEYYHENGPAAAWAGHIAGPFDLFGYEGYLALLVGQKVPYRRVHEITPQERQVWAAIQQNNRNQAAAGMTVREAMDVVHSPHFRVRDGFFRYP